MIKPTLGVMDEDTWTGIGAVGVSLVPSKFLETPIVTIQTLCDFNSQHQLHYLFHIQSVYVYRIRKHVGKNSLLLVNIATNNV